MMWRSFIYKATACSLAVSALSVTHHAKADPLGDPQRGRYLAVASDCVACHTAPHGQPFAGGLAMHTPLGIMYSTNITPSLSAGIGHYSLEDFKKAVRRGVRKDGANLYPAMPYTSYSYLTDQDIADLYVYFQKEVAPIDKKGPVTALPFPMNIRFSMAFWNMLFLNGKPYQSDPTKSAEWNRGAYLVEGATHCGTCHTPRGFLMQEDLAHPLSGASLGTWYAPNITPDAVSGIGSWSAQELTEYLHTGRLHDKAQAGGGMGEAVEHSFSHMSSDDLNAIGVYLHSLKPVSNPQEQTSSRFTQGSDVNPAIKLRGVVPIMDHNDDAASGASLFMGNCASCHGASAQGSKDGYYPSLWHNSVTGASRGDNLISTILYGVSRSVEGHQAFMPGFGGKSGDAVQLDDNQIAKLSNFVFKTYGRPGVQVTPQDVALIRKGGPASPLLLLARVGMAAGAILALILCVVLFAIRRHKNRNVA